MRVGLRRGARVMNPPYVLLEVIVDDDTWVHALVRGLTRALGGKMSRAIEVGIGPTGRVGLGCMFKDEHIAAFALEVFMSNVDDVEHELWRVVPYEMKHDAIISVCGCVAAVDCRP